MKVLISAYACEPGLGSEPGVGWNVALAIAQHHEVWVLTRIAHQPGIEAELSRNPLTNIHFVYFDPFNWTDDWRRGQRGVQLHYYLWQIQAYFEAQRLHRQIHFDLIHHITYVKYWGPSFLSLLPTPFIWGPVGGGETAPKAFWGDFSRRGQVYEVLRDVAHWVGELDPFVHLTARRSTLALATTEETAERLRQLKAKNVQVFSQLGLLKEELDLLSQYPVPEENPVRFISIGRLLHWKGFHLGLRAFAAAQLEQAEYWIVGDGPEQERLQLLTEDLGITTQVKFWGGLAREEALSQLGQCHVLSHPSLHDSGGLVCLEAMAAGRPVICLDLGGPATQVTEETGFKISAVTPEQAVQDLAEAMTRLANDPQLRTRMGQAAQRRVSEVYHWDGKGRLFAQFYEEIVL